MEGARLSVCSELSRSSSLSSYDSRASASTASPPSLRRQVSAHHAQPPAPVYISNLTVHKGGTGVRNEHLMNFTLNQFIGVVPGEGGAVSPLDPAVLEDLVTDAVKINTQTKKQFLKDDLWKHKVGLYGTKEDLAKAQKKWCFWLLGLVVVLSIIPLAITALFSVLSALPPPPPHHVGPGHLNNALLPDDPNADIVNMREAPRIFPRAFWVAQPPTGVLDNNTLPVRQVVVCYTATDECDTPAECALRVRYIQEFHIYSRKWFDIGYNFLIGSDGNVYEGRGWDFMGAHTKGHNNGTLGVAFIGTFAREQPNPDMVDAFNKLVNVGVEAGKIAEDYSLVAQCQLTVTGAPGMALARYMSSWPHYDHSLPLRCT